MKAAIAPAFCHVNVIHFAFSISLGLFPVISKVIPLLFPAFWICPWTDMCVCTCSWRCPMCKEARERVSQKSEYSQLGYLN